MSADIYLQIAMAKGTRGSNWVRDGKFRFIVRRLLLEPCEGGQQFVAELRVLTSQSVDVPEAQKNTEEAGKTITANAPGTDCSVIMQSKQKSFAANVKSLLLALDGTPEDQVDPVKFAQMIRDVTSAAQPLRGAYVDDSTYRSKIKSGPNAGKWYVGHNWEHVPQNMAEITARRAQLDASDKAAAAQQ